ncbi:MAG: hypothetical protein NVSMB64_10720 [Candidatus Velthaea sp.]
MRTPTPSRSIHDAVECRIACAPRTLVLVTLARVAILRTACKIAPGGGTPPGSLENTKAWASKYSPTPSRSFA